MKANRTKTNTFRKRKSTTTKNLLWNMKGCSKSKCKMCGPNCRCGANCSCKKNCPGNCHSGMHIGGGGPGDNNYGYPSPPGPYPPNPQHAYTGTSPQRGGGCGCGHLGGGGGCGLRGGGCGCGQRGGNGIVPAPLQGPAWSPNSSLPGVVTPHSGSQYGMNSYKLQPDYTPNFSERTNDGMSGGGGRRRRQRRRNGISRKQQQRGGFGVSGITSQIGTDLTNAYNTLKGVATVPSPLPYEAQYARIPPNNLAYLKQ